ncbi:MAG: DUF5693 family protein [Halanaerobiaceae bacterium]
MRKIKKNIILVILLITVFAAVFSIWGRYEAENSADGVELIMDFEEVKKLEIDRETYLSHLEDKGLTAVAIYPDNIRSLVNSGEAQLITGNELIRTATTTGSLNPVLEAYSFDKESAFMVINNNKYHQRFKEALPIWGEKHNLQYELTDNRMLIFFEEWEHDLLNLTLGFDQELINIIKKNNLKVVPRFYDNDISNLTNWELMNTLSPEFIIFAGTEITGYKSDGREDLEKTAEIMEQNNIVFGMIESFIANQKGADTLAYYLNYNVLRVHSIRQQEMDQRENYDMEIIIDRYIRAVRERNVRLLYLRPFQEEKNGLDPAELTLNYVNKLSTKLNDSGYQPGRTEKYQQYSSHNALLLLTGLGIILGGLLLLEKLIGLSFNKYLYLLLAAGFILQLLFIFMGREILLRKILALGSSVIFPSLAVITQLLSGETKKWLFRFLKATGISLLGALFLSASLSHISFILKIDQFVGVKLSFLLPIVIISVYYLINNINLSKINLIKKTIDLLESSIKVKHILILAMLAVGALVYIGRTGNNPIITVPDFEVLFRNLLERILYIRPRFKEFLIGHPFFIISLGLRKRINSPLIFYPLVIIASIGQINILNTFSHIHTPFFISLLRTFHGLWIGILIGILLLVIIRSIILVWGRKKVKYYD